MAGGRAHLRRQGERRGDHAWHRLPSAEAATEKWPTRAVIAEVYQRDRYQCRYCGAKVILTPVMRLIARLYPEQFPYHANWKADSTHPAFPARLPAPLLVDAGGLPRAVSLTGGHRTDIPQPIPPLDAVPPIRGVRGRSRRRPRELVADRGHHHDKYRRLLRARGIAPRIARRGVAHGSGPARKRWGIERGVAWLPAVKRLRTRYERRADLHLGLLPLACALICYRQLAVVLQ